MRGGRFHTFLVEEAAVVLESHGFAVDRERPLRLAEGGLDFLDLLATRGQLVVAVEVETTPRNAASNAQKALKLNLPLLFVVPSRAIRNAVAQRIEGELAVDSARIWILLPDELSQTLTRCFPVFSGGE